MSKQEFDLQERYNNDIEEIKNHIKQSDISNPELYNTIITHDVNVNIQKYMRTKFTHNDVVDIISKFRIDISDALSKSLQPTTIDKIPTIRSSINNFINLTKPTINYNIKSNDLTNSYKKLHKIILAYIEIIENKSMNYENDNIFYKIIRKTKKKFINDNWFKLSLLMIIICIIVIIIFDYSELDNKELEEDTKAGMNISHHSELDNKELAEDAKAGLVISILWTIYNYIF